MKEFFVINLAVTVARAAAAAVVVVSSLAMTSKQKCKTWCSGTEEPDSQRHC